MLSIRVLVLILVPLLIECKSSALFCTHEKNNDYEVNRLQSVFTIKNRVYIRVGINTSKLWVYDIDKEQVLDKQIIGEQMFPGLPIVEFVSVVLCDQCPKEVSNLVIAVGKKDHNSYHKFVTYRLQSDDTYVKIDQRDLPKTWGLRDGEEEFSLDAPFYGFFPEDMVNLQTNWSLIHGFTFFPSLQIFNLKFYTEINRNKSARHMLWRKVQTDGNLTDWKDIIFKGQPKTLNSAFYIKDKIYTIDNDPQYMPRISLQILPEFQNDKLSITWKDINLEARKFFNCTDKPTPAPTVPPVPTVTVPTTTTTKSTTTSEEITSTKTSTTPPSKTSPTTTQANTVKTTETTEGSTTLSTSSGTQVSTKLTTSEITDTTARESSGSTVTATPQKNDDKEKDNYTVFWLLFFVLILVILVVVFCLVFICIYMRKPNKGNMYNSLGNEGSNSDMDESPVVLVGSPDSTMSMRSRNDNLNNDEKRADIQSPSTASMRSYHDSKKPMNSEFKEGNPQSSTSPSTTSMRSSHESKKPLKSKFKEGSPQSSTSPSTTSMRSSHESKKPLKSKFKEGSPQSSTSPSTASVRSFKN